MPTAGAPCLLVAGTRRDLIVYVVASPGQRPASRCRRTADRLSGFGSGPVQSRSGTGRRVPTFAAREAKEKERQRHSCYDCSHIPVSRFAENAERLAPTSLALVSQIVIRNLDLLFAQRQRDVVSESD